MGCIYCNFDGTCQLDDGTFEMPGVSEGVCVVVDDPDPAYTCEDYEEG